MIRLKDLFVVILGSALFAFALFRIFPSKNSFSSIISPLAEGFELTRNVLFEGKKGSLEKIVKMSLANTQGEYGIVIKNLSTGESYSLNETRRFDSASLYKLWVLGEAYGQVIQGRLSPDEVLSNEVEELNKLFKIASESAELTEGTISMKVSEAIEQMITVSHNYAALLLASEIKNSNVSNFMREQGFNNSRLGEPPTTTAEDIALFFEKLYHGTMIDSETSKKMLDLLVQQKLNDRIPKYLPDNIEVAHKTGEIDGFKHDAGIIFGKDPILIVVLSESNSPQGAAERIAQLSKNVFNYFESK